MFKSNPDSPILSRLDMVEKARVKLSFLAQEKPLGEERRGIFYR